MGCDRYKHFENCPYDTECPDHKYWEKIEASSVRVDLPCSIADGSSVVAIARILFNLEYAAYNLCGKTVDDLPLGISESTGADDSLLIAIRDLKEIERGMQL